MFLFRKRTQTVHIFLQSRIKLADQDILNILFHYYPEKLYELPCEWNYRVWLCSEVNKCICSNLDHLYHVELDLQSLFGLHVT